MEETETQAAPKPKKSYYKPRKVMIDVKDRTRPTMTKPELWNVCATSGCDPRTLKKVWEGKLVQEGAGYRAWAALKNAGLLRGEAKAPFPPKDDQIPVAGVPKGA